MFLQWNSRDRRAGAASMLDIMDQDTGSARTQCGVRRCVAALLPSLQFKPGVHVNYAESVLPMKDGLPKLKDFPKELGGSGETVRE